MCCCVASTANAQHDDYSALDSNRVVAVEKESGELPINDLRATDFATHIESKDAAAYHAEEIIPARRTRNPNLFEWTEFAKSNIVKEIATDNQPDNQPDNQAQCETDVTAFINRHKFEFVLSEFDSEFDSFSLERDSSFNPIGTEKHKTRFSDSASRFKEENDDAAANQTGYANGNGDTRFQWKSAIGQSLMFLGVQHGYAMTQPKTRRSLRGPFLRDYFRSVKSLGGWEDGGRFFTNYIAHPMQGSMTGFIYVQNDPRARKQQFGMERAYWMSRMKAMAWTAAWSTQFEIGPISQASIGNVGLSGKQTWIDMVVTPTIGTGLLITEDAIDRYTRPLIENRFKSKYVRIFSRMLLNPTRNFSNLLRFEKPWKRDIKTSDLY